MHVLDSLLSIPTSFRHAGVSKMMVLLRKKEKTPAWRGRYHKKVISDRAGD
ncbi:hypothetical protein D777_03298 [Marinobacter nitratireducens]|uniref:Uncharacterized protein n=1 Tax=Marinobacter nitratireducens TaxID=1137280 RepID=A0A072MYU6_9GAMM|nr:hypothetical protein D777_03298 [Marinobacter nitratireducens]